MKKIIAYIRKEKADIVIENLEQAGVKGVTLIDANTLAEWADKKAFRIKTGAVNDFNNL
jgi:nitrogen regulatory protein PII